MLRSLRSLRFSYVGRSFFQAIILLHLSPLSCACDKRLELQRPELAQISGVSKLTAEVLAIDDGLLIPSTLTYAGDN